VPLDNHIILPSDISFNMTCLNYCLKLDSFKYRAAFEIVGGRSVPNDYSLITGTQQFGGYILKDEDATVLTIPLERLHVGHLCSELIIC